MRRPYGRGILQSRSRDFLIGSHEYLLLFKVRLEPLGALPWVVQCCLFVYFEVQIALTF